MKELGERIHKPEWTEEEKKVLKENISLTYDELRFLLPNRSKSAIKNKVKQIKYGKYHKHSKMRY